MTRGLHDILRSRTFTSTRMNVVYMQGNPFIGAKRKRVPAVIRQTGCIIDRGIEFSLCPCPFVLFASSLSFSASLSISYLYPLHPFIRCHCTQPHTYIQILFLSFSYVLSSLILRSFSRSYFPFYLSLLPLRTSH